MDIEDPSEQIRKELEQQLTEFEKFLQAKLKPRTVYGHAVVLQQHVRSD